MAQNSGYKRQRGFAAMDEEKRREIARKGGKAAQEKGTAHRFTSIEASEAGRKGGQASHEKRAAIKIRTEQEGMPAVAGGEDT